MFKIPPFGEVNIYKGLIQTWRKRNLNLFGKVCIIKTFLISQLVFVMQVIRVPDVILKEVNTLLYRFLWKKKDSNKKAFEKVKRVVMNSGIECVE